MTKVLFKQGSVDNVKTKALVINLFADLEKKDNWLGGAAALVDKALDGYISRLIENKEFKGKEKELVIFPTFGKLPAEKIVIVGMGKKENLDLNVCRRAGGEVVKKLLAGKIDSFSTITFGAGAGALDEETAAQAMVEGMILGGYKFKGLKTKKEENGGMFLRSFEIVEISPRKLVGIKRGGKKGEILANATNWARDLVNLPANIATPTYLVNEAKKIAVKNPKLKLKVYSESQIRKLKMGAFLSVTQGSSEPCKLIVFEYKGSTAKDKIGLVGKGVTFDSGGISIKPSSKMREMKGDMAGAAAVLGAFKAIAELKLKKNIVGVIPATENMPGKNAVKPGDVVTASNGKTIEYTSTDAEGRMLLADALVYAQKLGAKKVINIATLTGACPVALGELYAGIMGNDQKLIDQTIAAGKNCGEKIWQLPLDDGFKDLLKSDTADMINCSEDRKAGTINGGMFLQEFIEKGTKWAHLDVAGTADIHSKIDVFEKGATGFGVRTFLEILQ
jgi:leucyl aminopeptidase